MYFLTNVSIYQDFYSSFEVTNTLVFETENRLSLSIMCLKIMQSEVTKLYKQNNTYTGSSYLGATQCNAILHFYFFLSGG